MLDLDLAKTVLKERNLSLVIAKRSRLLFESRSSGISGLLQAVGDLKENLHDSSVADRVVGRAAALVLAQSGVKGVYAATLSKEGLRVLEENDIYIEHDNLVPKILDKEGKSICPFERFSATIESVDEAYEELRTFAESLRERG